MSMSLFVLVLYNMKVILLYHLELNIVFFLLVVVKIGGWFISTSCWDVSVCQYT